MMLHRNTSAPAMLHRSTGDQATVRSSAFAPFVACNPLQSCIVTCVVGELAPPLVAMSDVVARGCNSDVGAEILSPPYLRPLHHRTLRKHVASSCVSLKQVLPVSTSCYLQRWWMQQRFCTVPPNLKIRLFNSRSGRNSILATRWRETGAASVVIWVVPVSSGGENEQIKGVCVCVGGGGGGAPR